VARLAWLPRGRLEPRVRWTGSVGITGCCHRRHAVLIPGDMQHDGPAADGAVFHIVLVVATDMHLNINPLATVRTTNSRLIKIAHSNTRFILNDNHMVFPVDV